MKNRFKIYLILLVAMFCMAASCDQNVVEKKELQYEFKVVEIDGCEYIAYDRGHGYRGFGYLAHKGNCKYCAERQKKQIEELLNK